MRLAHLSSARPASRLFQRGTGNRRQQGTCRARPGKNRGRTVALMHVAIQGHRGANLVVALHAADRNSYIVDHAESLAMIGKSMMKPAANADRDLIGQA